MTQQEIVKLIDEAFSSVVKPLHFANHKHCKECSEIDNYFSERADDPCCDGDPGDRICFLYPNAFKYFMPQFVKYAFSKTDSEFFDDLVTFYLGVSLFEEDENRLSEFSRQQLIATYAFVKFSVIKYREIFLRDGHTNKELERIIEWWKNFLKLSHKMAEQAG
jgi:hypothetical protein